MGYVAEKKGEPLSIAAVANTWITAPMTSGEGVLGAITLTASVPLASHRVEESRRVLEKHLHCRGEWVLCLEG